MSTGFSSAIRTTIKDAMLIFETYTATLASKGEAIDAVMRKADTCLRGLRQRLAKIDNVLPGLSDGKVDELFEKVKSIRELAETFNKNPGA